MKSGIILDLETTGLNPKEDKIIEIGILKITLDSDYKPYYASSYSELQDPKIPLPSLIEKITGLSDSLLKGQAINWEKVKKDLTEASFIIAHNMPFDKSFLMELDFLSDLKTHWACSQKHIDWHRLGFKSQALNYLACDHGFVNPFPHRALFDCATTYKLISPYFRELLSTSLETEYELMATHAPFKSKDLLKERGYHWNPQKKVWYKSVFQKDLAEEENFLVTKIYEGKKLYQERKL